MAYSVAIDGPAGAGYNRPGNMYRAMAVYFSKNKVNPEDESAINEAVKMLI